MAFSALTLDEDGQRIMAIAAWVPDGGGLQSYALYPYTPAGYDEASYPDSDTITGLILTGPSSASGVSVAPADLPFDGGGIGEWVTHLLALNPATPPTAAATVYEVLDAGDETDWLELKAAQGAMFEVVELDLDGLPAGAIPTDIAIQLRHEADQPSKIRLAPVGINADDTIVLATERNGGYQPIPLGTAQETTTALWSAFEDGSRLHDFDRLGVALIVSGAAERVVSHRVYWLRALLSFDLGGPVVATVTPPASPGDPVAWTYTSSEGLPQSHYRVLVQEGTSQDPTLATVGDPTALVAGDIVFDSGKVAASLVRELLISAALSNGDQTVSVKAWASLTSGESVDSAWTSGNFNLGGAATGPAQSTNPAFSALTGSVLVTVTAPAAVSRAHLYRSIDAGATWALVEGSPFTVTPSADTVITDAYAPVNEDAITYQVTFDAGVATETSDPVALPGAGVDSAVTDWYFICPEDETLTLIPDIMEYRLERPMRSVVVDSPNGATVASSPMLSHRLNLTVRTKNKAERLAIEALLTSGYKFRVVDILSREFLCRLESGNDQNMQRWMPLQSESTGLRDAHYMPISLVEVDS